MHPYRKIFVVSIFITIILFWYDWRNDTHRDIAFGQRAWGILAWGCIYVLSIFIVASVLYFCISKLSRLLRKVFATKE